MDLLLLIVYMFIPYKFIGVELLENKNNVGRALALCIGCWLDFEMWALHSKMEVVECKLAGVDFVHN